MPVTGADTERAVQRFGGFHAERQRTFATTLARNISALARVLRGDSPAVNAGSGCVLDIGAIPPISSTQRAGRQAKVAGGQRQRRRGLRLRGDYAIALVPLDSATRIDDHLMRWSEDGRMSEGEKTEKITINLGLVDLGQVD
ncbi:MAG: hypothetical protein ACRD0K_27440, partial [Egibacteraceae bacterium]